MNNIAAGFFPRSVDLFLPFRVSVAGKVFRNRVIVAVTATTHAAFQTMWFQARQQLMARVLTALIRVHQYLFLRITSPHRHK